MPKRTLATFGPAKASLDSAIQRYGLTTRSAPVRSIDKQQFIKVISTVTTAEFSNRITMAAYYRKKRRRSRYTPAEKKRYWDRKTLENPDEIPSNYDYNVPEVPEPESGPYSFEFGLNHDEVQILEYYRDKSSKVPYCFNDKIRENLGELASTALGTAIIAGLMAFAADSSRGSEKVMGIFAIFMGAVGGIMCINHLWHLVSTPIRARAAKTNFARLSPTSGRSPLLNGKTLNEAMMIWDKWQEAVKSRDTQYAQKCEARTAEIWRRHRLRVERLTTAAELERLRREEKSKAAQYEQETFPTLALNPHYWTAGATNEEKGINLEQKFGRLLRDAGFIVQFTPPSGDDGIDIIANKDGTRIVVQCKNYVSKVAANEIRDFAGAIKFVRESCPGTIGWLVAPNGFSEATFDKFHRPGDIELWDFSDIQDLVTDTYKNSGDVADDELGASEQ
jgi:hypothetical protein